MKNNSLATSYLIGNNSNPVQLTLIVGPNGQTGSSTIQVNGNYLKSAYRGDLFNFPIGTNNDLVGKNLVVTTVISDTNNAPMNNQTELILKLKGGIVIRDFALSKEAEEGGTATYLCYFNFVQI